MRQTNKENMIIALKKARNNLVFAVSQRIRLTNKELVLLIKLDHFLSDCDE